MTDFLEPPGQPPLPFGDDGRPEYADGRAPIEMDGQTFLPLSEPEVPHSLGHRMANPLPQYRCVAVTQAGERCTNNGIAGLPPDRAICRRHGGGQLNVLEYAKAQQEAARIRLYGEIDGAIDALHALIQPGTGEAVRLAAANSILEKTGLGGKQEIHIEVEEVSNAADVVRERLEKIRLAQLNADARLSALEADSESESTEILDAEVLDDE